MGNRTFLFSPVGSNDPFGNNNGFDGSMLHIIRQRAPDAVFLYFSAAMVPNRDNCCNAIKELSKLLVRPVPRIECIEDKDNLNPQEHDKYYRAFSRIIKEQIIPSMTDGDKLILNISSGTPGMKGALLVLGSLGEIKCQCVRVDFNKNIIEHPWAGRTLPHEEIAKKLANSPENSDRTRTEILENLIYITQRRQIAEFVKSYDYDAAYSMAKGLDAALTAPYIDWLAAARDRSHLMLEKVRNFERLSHAKLLPFEGPEANMFEYALECDLKLRRGELADFIRSLSPLIFDLFRLTCEANTPVTEQFLDKFTFKSKRNGALCWDRAKLESESDGGNDMASKVLDVFRKTYKNGQWNQPIRGQILVTSDNFCHIIKVFSDNALLKDDIVRMRDRVESTVRNCAAHQMVSVNDNKIKKMTFDPNTNRSMSSRDIMSLIKRIFSYTSYGIGSGDPAWDSYDAMNRIIVAKLNESPREA